mmetsp:Transcript_14764/g.44333  ORF Transcript_14764/g.44333 Transcript_14764/m.44333 type:complete len:243 (+) Transcript_14764:976-1704(+)
MYAEGWSMSSRTAGRSTAKCPDFWSAPMIWRHTAAFRLAEALRDRSTRARNLAYSRLMAPSFSFAPRSCLSIHRSSIIACMTRSLNVYSVKMLGFESMCLRLPARKGWFMSFGLMCSRKRRRSLSLSWLLCVTMKGLVMSWMVNLFPRITPSTQYAKYLAIRAQKAFLAPRRRESSFTKWYTSRMASMDASLSAMSSGRPLGRLLWLPLIFSTLPPSSGWNFASQAPGRMPGCLVFVLYVIL